jgi:centractin
LQLLLRKAGYYFYTSAEKEVVRSIKETACYIAFDPNKEEELLESNNKPATHKYKLPDGNIIEIGPERFRAPEILFHPEFIGEEYPGVHECLVNSIQRSDLDLRKTLYSNIVLSGGSTLFPGRLLIPNAVCTSVIAVSDLSCVHLSLKSVHIC